MPFHANVVPPSSWVLLRVGYMPPVELTPPKNAVPEVYTFWNDVPIVPIEYLLFAVAVILPVSKAVDETVPATSSCADGALVPIPKRLLASSQKKFALFWEMEPEEVANKTLPGVMVVIPKFVVVVFVPVAFVHVRLIKLDGAEPFTVRFVMVPFVANRFVEVALVEVVFVNIPVEAVVPPIGVPLIVPPVMVTF